MNGHSTEEILRAAAGWAWLPRGGEQEQVDLLLVRYPERFGGGVRASQVDSTRTPAEVLDGALARTRAWGERAFTFWSSAADRPDLQEELVRRGAEHVDTVAVLARPIAGESVVVPARVSVEVVQTLQQVREEDAINVAVWEQQPLDEQGLREELAEVQRGMADGEGFRVLARVDGVAVSAGGCTLVDGFARLWGAATVAEYRGRGAYRAVLAERMRVAGEQGASTALVKGRLATSAPILNRAGFVHYGDEHAYRLAAL